GAINTHRIVEHPPSPTFRCTICWEPLKTEYSRTVHTRTHTEKKKPFTCGTCRIPFSTKDLLTIHVIKHINKTPFACDFDWCDKRYSSPGGLSSHKKTHTIEGQIRRKK
ncbi:unnamed protein product, partial [Ectocarpus sp. 8 AP-2014]